MRTFLLVISTFIISVITPLHAANVDPSDYNSSRTKGAFVNPDGGITFNGGLGALESYTIGWNIADLGSNNFQYMYTLQELADISSPSQGSFFLQLGNGLTAASLTNISINGNPLSSFTDVSVTDATIGSDVGVLIASTMDTLITTVGFDALASPIYGDFQHGDSNLLGFAQNTGFGTSPISPYLDWIATPGGTGGVPVPEPTTMLLLATALSSGLMKTRRRKLT